MGENKRLVKFEQAGRDEDLGVKKLREKEIEGEEIWGW